ncbi:MAG: hypothetical protein ACOYW4_07015 [Bacillota bacterium]
MEDRLSPVDEMRDAGAGNESRGENAGAGGRGGNNRGGRVNTSAWLIGVLVVIIAVFAGLRFARVPAPPRPAPTRPAPTRPAPTAPAPAVTDLERDITRVESAVKRRDWATAEREALRLRTTWQSLRPRVTSPNTTKDVTTFDARVDKLISDIRAKNEAGARADITELKALAKRFRLSPTRGPTSG